MTLRATCLLAGVVGVTVLAGAEEVDAPSYRKQLAQEAVALIPLAETELGKQFLAIADDLPAMKEPRTVFFKREGRQAITPDAYEALAEAEREGFREMPITEARYYGLYSTPLAYLRAIDIACAHGLSDVDGRRIADFGFGNMGQLRMLASMGAHVIGIEIDGFHDVMLRMASDQGEVARAPEAGAGSPGSVQLVFGQYPASEQIINEVGGGLALFMSKNTLKKSYIHPEREANPAQLVHLGVDDETYVQAVFDALAPGGLFVIYNLYPKPAPPDEPYIPWASGECPFARELIERVGFEIPAWNITDHDQARAMGRALGWHEGMTDEAFEEGFNAMYTVLRRPD